MSDMTAVIAPKSDQINADDLITGPRTVTIAGVKVAPGTEQPVAVAIDGDRKVFRPCKSMMRVMVNAWGPDSSKYAGHSMTLYRDPKVKWGGAEIGGIRISHMTGINNPMTMALSESKAVRKPFTVKPLATQRTDRPSPSQPPEAAGEPNNDAGRPEAASQGRDKQAEYLDWFLLELASCGHAAAVEGLQIDEEATLAKLADRRPELYDRAVAAIKSAKAAFADEVEG